MHCLVIEVCLKCSFTFVYNTSMPYTALSLQL